MTIRTPAQQAAADQLEITARNVVAGYVEAIASMTDFSRVDTLIAVSREVDKRHRTEDLSTLLAEAMIQVHEWKQKGGQR